MIISMGWGLISGIRMNSRKMCKFCKKWVLAKTGVQCPIGFFCSRDDAIRFANEQQAKATKRKLAKLKRDKKVTDKAARATHRADKERVRSISEWRDKLQTVVNQYVLHVLEKDAPCRTCGTTNNIKYDAGHWLTRAARSELRFNLYNIHKQCSVNCNQHASGAKQEHEKYISDTYGQHIVDWLKSRHHPSLKEKFPHYEDIKAEIIRYRKLLRSNGLNPNA